ncbi:MAG: hypothetical protein BGO76_07325 [Caedibacter sp. 38-128]|nr:hypothetical protein [Holosporales bacterium]OJX04820.1 MAG: hypothetical protein BGO76_07325 [Caedibacter sp. 38-128]
MKKTNLLMILAALAIQSSSIWASATTPTEELTEEAALVAKIKALQVQNTADEQALAQAAKIAELKAQLKAEEEKAALLAAQKKQQEEDANLPKTWEGIPWTIMHTAWVNNYQAIESTFDPRKSSNSFIRESSKLLAKNGGKKFKPAVSQINSSHTDVLKKHPNQWASSGLNEDTETHTNIARFLLDKIWLQAYQGKVGFKI